MEILLKFLGFTLLIPCLWVLLFIIMSGIIKVFQIDPDALVGSFFIIYYALLGGLLTYLTEKKCMHQ